MSSVKDQGPIHWRTLAERDGDPEFSKVAEREFSTELEGDIAEAELSPADSTGRRRFLKVMGGAAAAAATVACGEEQDGIRWKKDYILPFSRRPPDHVPGVPKSFSTVYEHAGVGIGVRVTSYDGRPIKVEGNPNHPDSLGAATVFAQAAVFEMYDPDRSRGPARIAGAKRSAADWASFEGEGRKIFDNSKAKGGQGLVFVSEASSSPALADMLRRLMNEYPQAKWYEWEPASRDNARAGAALAFGAAHRTHVQLEKARVVLCLDADVMSEEPSALRHARAMMSTRKPEAGYMTRLYAVESRFTSTGGVADHRLPLPSTYIKAFAATLDAEVSAALGGDAAGGAQQKPAAAFLNGPKVAAFLKTVVKELVANRGKSAVVVGPSQPPVVHALVHRINEVLGNVGGAISYLAEPEPARPHHRDAIKTLVGEMNSGQVETIVVLGANPVYDAPADLGFEKAYSKIKYRIRLGVYEDETSNASTWHLPAAHWLERWWDARASDGTLSIAQPIVEPLFQGRTPTELLAFILNDEQQKGLDILRRVHAGWGSDDRAWKRALHEGIVPGTAFNGTEPEVQTIAPVKLTAEELGGLDVENGKLELVLCPDSKVYDGRFGNNPWLQELPDMMTKLTWDNAALMSPATAEKLGVGDATWVELSIGSRSLEVPALMAPGVAPGTVVLSYGYGRTHAGRFGGQPGVDPVGANAYALRTTEVFDPSRGLSVKATGKRAKLSTTQDKHVIDQVGRDGTEERLPQLVREQTLAAYKKQPDAVRHAVHHEPLLSLWNEPVSYDGHKWGMSVDLSRCVGCNACIVACQAENNIPVVGKHKVSRGKEMHWLRIDRYFKGDAEDPQLVQQPVTCHHCEHAPCEQVCPVAATSHSSEGLNDMVYNRCIGTRYCSNNCPYKVRRFNFHNYHDDMKDPDNQVKGMSFNPEVTVRFRGVMEKCSFCVQRIRKVTIEAKNHRRPVEDGEIVTACQQTCPTEAIVFGDLNDGASRVAELQNRPRSYAMLEELNVRPRLKYLARVRNPNPELAPPEEGDAKPKGGHG